MIGRSIKLINRPGVAIRISQPRASWTAIVDHAWTKHASVAKLAGFFYEDLNGRLPGRNKDTDQRLGAGDRVEGQSNLGLVIDIAA